MSHYHCPQLTGPRISSDAAAGQVAAVAIDVNDSLCDYSTRSDVDRLVRISDFANQTAVAGKINEETNP